MDEYVLVPIKLTTKMREVLEDMLTNCHTIEESYADLLEAAPNLLQTKFDWVDDVNRRFKR